jgi:glycosyltransferase involved in cell wall biosynthesis
MIGCPVRNRGWILPRYLQCLDNLIYPREYIRFGFIINNCTDETPAILERYAALHPGQVDLVYSRLSSGGLHHRGSYNFKNLAALRNQLIALFLESDGDYLFSLDSDILIPPHSLQQLVDDDCDIVSMLVCNGHEVGDSGIFNILDHKPGSWIHRRDFPRDRVFPVDCTGAAYLIKRMVLKEHGVRYSARWGAEDIGFCQDALSKGLKIYCDGRLEGEHVMQEKTIETDNTDLI